MSETNDGQETGQDRPSMAFDERFITEAVKELVRTNDETPYPPGVYRNRLKNLVSLYDDAGHDPSTFWRSRIRMNETTIMPIRITEEPLTPLNLAFTIITLTELSTELWLIAQRRFADLVVFTQTHNINYVNQAGLTIAWITYNSPVNLGFNIDKIITGLADAIMTLINGVTQRKAHLQQLELENQAKAQQIEEARRKADDAAKMAELDREERKLNLSLRAWEAYNKTEAGTDILTGIAKMILIEDDSTKSMLQQLLLPTVLQLSNVKGLELVTAQTSQEDNPKEDAEQ